jgi:hypothetical protein
MTNSVYNRIKNVITSTAWNPSILLGGKGRLLFTVGLFSTGILLLCASFTSICRAADYITGEIIASRILQERIYFVPKDRAFTSLGMKDGLIKGDILQISVSGDSELINPVGRCALVRVDPDSSVCEIISVKNEISKGNQVHANRLNYTEERFYPIIYTLLYEAVEPYPPQKQISVYIHDIFDKKLNTTMFSMKAKREVENIFAQKSRILLKGDSLSKGLQFYPFDSPENQKTIDDFMKREDIDVFITGLYSVEDGQTNITFYKYDRYLGRQVLPFQVWTEAEMDAKETGEIIATYKAPEKQELVTCNISYNEFSDPVVKYGKTELVRYEAGGDMFKENDLRMREFNIVAPSEIAISVDNQRVRFDEKNESTIRLGKGSHKISATFRRGYFFNTKGSLVYASRKLVKKEIILVVKNAGSVNVSIDLNPSFSRENIKFSVYTERTDVRPQIKAIKSIKTDNVLETFID